MAESMLLVKEFDVEIILLKEFDVGIIYLRNSGQDEPPPQDAGGGGAAEASPFSHDAPAANNRALVIIRVIILYICLT